jgi:hypothetical protein
MKTLVGVQMVQFHCKTNHYILCELGKFKRGFKRCAQCYKKTPSLDHLTKEVSLEMYQKVLTQREDWNLIWFYHIQIHLLKNLSKYVAWTTPSKLIQRLVTFLSESSYLEMGKVICHWKGIEVRYIFEYINLFFWFPINLLFKLLAFSTKVLPWN